jgi:8-oxo-dGTP pyrophosphatase MutT (NUDIX family)
MPKAWHVLKSAVLIDRSPWIRLSEKDVVLPNGRSIEGYITWEEREYALSVALTQHGVPLVLQYKQGLQSHSLDLPGGYLNSDEDPLAAAQRELLEETGLASTRWIHMASLVLDNNRGSARTHLFLAFDTRVVALPCLDDTEDLTISFYDWKQLGEMVRDGKINSLPTVTALLMAMRRLDDDENPISSPSKSKPFCAFSGEE